MYNFKNVLPFLDEVNYEVLGNENNVSFNEAVNLDNQHETSIIWLKSGLQKNEIIANFIICNSVEGIKVDFNKQTILIVENPKNIFSHIVNGLLVKKKIATISKNCEISEFAKIGTNCSIASFAYIGDAFIGNNVQIKEGVIIYDGVEIGDNVIINAGTVIGADGFGYSKNPNGNIVKFPHLGGVIIENDVEIGANVCIDKGSLGNTILKEGCKIDNLVHIAHNVVVGKNAFVIANAMIAGSVTIQDNAWIAPSVSVLQQLNIGANSLVGVGSIVTKNIPDNEIWVGSPAKAIQKKN
jgi:UDP-3-O-[3-hydroxymyristoyl] glucosamine N-acyltransferase